MRASLSTGLLIASLTFGQECHMEPHGSGLVVCDLSGSTTESGGSLGTHSNGQSTLKVTPSIEAFGLMVCTDVAFADLHPGDKFNVTVIKLTPAGQAIIAKLDSEIEHRRAILQAAEAELRDALARRARLINSLTGERK